MSTILLTSFDPAAAEPITSSASALGVCGDGVDGVEREIPSFDGVGDNVLDVFDPDVSSLVEAATERHALTARQEYDVHTAITRGLANYLLLLDGGIGGRSCMLQSVIADWSESASGARGMPSAGVYCTDEISYSISSGLGPGKPRVVGDAPGGGKLAVIATGLFETEMLRVDVRCPDKELRAGVRQMLDRGLSPVTWMVGFRLVLPKYHNAVATFLPIAGAFPDTPELAQQGMWMIRLRLRVSCEMYQPHVLPLARPIASGTIS